MSTLTVLMSHMVYFNNMKRNLGHIKSHTETSPWTIRYFTNRLLYQMIVLLHGLVLSSLLFDFHVAIFLIARNQRNQRKLLMVVYHPVANDSYTCVFNIIKQCSLLLGNKEMLYLTMHSTHFIYGYMATHLVKDHSVREQKCCHCFIGSFINAIQQAG